MSKLKAVELISIKYGDFGPPMFIYAAYGDEDPTVRMLVHVRNDKVDEYFWQKVDTTLLEYWGFFSPKTKDYAWWREALKQTVVFHKTVVKQTLRTSRDGLHEVDPIRALELTTALFDKQIEKNKKHLLIILSTPVLEEALERVASLFNDHEYVEFQRASIHEKYVNLSNLIGYTRPGSSLEAKPAWWDDSPALKVWSPEC